MQGNETEAIFLKLIAENFSELMKDINQSIGSKAQLIQQD